MKKILRFPTLLFLLASAFCYDALGQGNEVTVPLSNPSARGKLKVDVNSGSITVTATSRKDVLVKYTSDEPAEKQPAQEGSKAGLKRISGSGLDLEITEYQNTVKVESGSWTKRISIEVEIPAGFDVHLHTYNNGALMVTGVQGSLELENYNGRITALNISGSVVASTYNGDIKVTFDKAAANTPMSFSTYNGDIEISIPQDYKASLKARTERGSIYSDFDIQFRSSGPVQKKQKQGDLYKVIIDEWKLGDLNGGGAELTMQNYNGDLIVRKK